MEQEITLGWELTIPSPVPAAVTDSRYWLDPVGEASLQPEHKKPITPSWTVNASRLLPVIAPERTDRAPVVKCGVEFW
jgi:hypothetical protein